MHRSGEQRIHRQVFESQQVGQWRRIGEPELLARQPIAIRKCQFHVVERVEEDVQGPSEFGCLDAGLDDTAPCRACNGIGDGSEARLANPHRGIG